MQDSRYQAYAWKSHKEFYEEVDGNIVFHKDTPKEILESYALYKEQIACLEKFPKERTNGLFSFLDKPKAKDSNVSIAKDVFEARFCERPIDRKLLSPSFLYIHWNKQVFSSIPKLEGMNPEICSIMRSKAGVSIVWTDGACDFVSVFWLDASSRILKMQDFICSQR